MNEEDNPIYCKGSFGGGNVEPGFKRYLLIYGE